MLHVPIRYINNGEPLDQVTLNRYMYDTQENLEELFSQISSSGGPGGSVSEVPDTLALRDSYGTTQFAPPRIGTNPLRLDDSSVDSIPNTIVMRDANGSISLGKPNSPESPIRAEDMIGFCGIFAINPGNDWVVCDGRAVSRSTYSPLFNKIGTIYGSGNGSTTFNVPNLGELLNVTDISGSSGSTIFGAWNNSFPSSGTAPEDGIIHARSSHNTRVSISIGGVEVQGTDRRDKYGQGRTSISAGIKKGQSYSISGSDYRRFLAVDVSLPTPSKIKLPVNYYIRAR